MILNKKFRIYEIAINFIKIWLSTVGAIFTLLQTLHFFWDFQYEVIMDLGLFVLLISVPLAYLVSCLLRKNEIRYKIVPEIKKMNINLSEYYIGEDEVTNAEKIISMWDNDEIPADRHQFYASKYRCEQYINDVSIHNARIKKYENLSGSFYLLNFTIYNESTFFDESAYFGFRPEEELLKNEFCIFSDFFEELTEAPRLLDLREDKILFDTKELFKRKPTSVQEFNSVNEDGIFINFGDFRGETGFSAFDPLQDAIVFTTLEQVKFTVAMNSKLKSWSKQCIVLDFKNASSV